MRKMALSFVAIMMLLTMPSVAFAAGGRDDNGVNMMRDNRSVNRFNDGNIGMDNDLRLNGVLGNDGVNNNRFRTMNTDNNRRFNTNNDWNNNMTTRNMGNGNVYRANAADDGTDWGWLGLLGLIGLAGMMGRGRDRGDAR